MRGASNAQSRTSSPVSLYRITTQSRRSSQTTSSSNWKRADSCTMVGTGANGSGIVML